MSSKLTQLGVLCIMVTGLVVLTLKGKDTSAFIAFLGPLAAGLFVVERVEKRSDKQDEKLSHQDEVLDKIQENTNGVMIERIEQGVENVLTRRESGED